MSVTAYHSFGGEVGGFEHPHDTPPYPFMPSPTFAHSSHRRYYYDTHGQLRLHLVDFLAAYNFAKRLKMLNGLIPHEYVCQTWTTEPLHFRINPTHHTAGLYS